MIEDIYKIIYNYLKENITTIEIVFPYQQKIISSSEWLEIHLLDFRFLPLQRGKNNNELIAEALLNLSFFSKSENVYNNIQNVDTVLTLVKNIEINEDEDYLIRFYEPNIVNVFQRKQEQITIERIFQHDVLEVDIKIFKL